MDRKSIGNSVMLKEYSFYKETKINDIFIPEIVKKEVEDKFWEVVELGTGELDKNGIMIPFKVGVGDIVMISNDKPPTTAFWDGTRVLIVNQKAVLAKVEKQ